MSIKKTTVAELCQLNAELNSENGLLSERLPMGLNIICLKLQKLQLMKIRLLIL
jgi:hypothetical protein